jgi:hypothetical protein
VVSFLFGIARAAAWGSAAFRGPRVVARRARNKVVYKAVGRALRKF